ncbi:MAG: hypothetical protein O2868_17195, partial [Proteobacteria bacterium]|nr:hypothetical protein [Pseudomonadota bacterium]
SGTLKAFILALFDGVGPRETCQHVYVVRDSGTLKAFILALFDGVGPRETCQHVYVVRDSGTLKAVIGQRTRASA